jgi:hypothetical protein
LKEKKKKKKKKKTTKKKREKKKMEQMKEAQREQRLCMESSGFVGRAPPQMRMMGGNQCVS